METEEERFFNEVQAELKGRQEMNALDAHSEMMFQRIFGEQNASVGETESGA